MNLTHLTTYTDTRIKTDTDNTEDAYGGARRFRRSTPGWGSARSLASLFIEANTPKQAFLMSIEARWKH